MTLNSIVFIFIFLPIVFFLYHLLPKKAKNLFLFLASLFFYAWNEPIYVIGLFLLIYLNYFFAQRMQKGRSYRKSSFYQILTINLFILLYFKYYGFFLENLFHFVPIKASYTLFGVPLGISFVIFQVISYQIDVYTSKSKACQNFISFGLYVSFFPKLLMGPITRYEDMQENLENRKVTFASLEQGIVFFITGLAQKVILADTFALLCTSLSQPTSVLAAWLGILAFTFQIYFDFNGYSKMAIGIGTFFGFHLPENFNYPYIATSIKDFWSRWHMTLSKWFRDYIYIPLGGNRTTKRKWIRNILVVWLTTGLWHGASFTYILWGLYFGILLILEKRFPFPKGHSVLQRIFTFILVMIGWVFFSHDTIASSFTYLGKMFGMGVSSLMDTQFLWYFQNYGIYILCGFIGMTPLMKQLGMAFQVERPHLYKLMTTCLYMVLFVISIAYLLGAGYEAFMYAQF